MNRRGSLLNGLRAQHDALHESSDDHASVESFEAIDVCYEISAAKPLTIDVVPGWVSFAEKTLDAFGLQYTCRRVHDADGNLGKCIFSVPAKIPARASFAIDHRTGLVTVTLVNVDRLERVTVELGTAAIDEAVLEDLARLMLSGDSSFLKHARMAGLHGRAVG